jgi:hypothetical protein
MFSLLKSTTKLSLTYGGLPQSNSMPHTILARKKPTPRFSHAKSPPFHRRTTSNSGAELPGAKASLIFIRIHGFQTIASCSPMARLPPLHTSRCPCRYLVPASDCLSSKRSDPRLPILERHFGLQPTCIVCLPIPKFYLLNVESENISGTNEVNRLRQAGNWYNSSSFPGSTSLLQVMNALNAAVCTKYAHAHAHIPLEFKTLTTILFR